MNQTPRVLSIGAVIGFAARIALALALGDAVVVHAQMSIPGQFSVNQTGAATYTIPIKVPPGVAGMEPKLSLMYNSQAGNGLLGMGWSLAGLSAITRCPQTSAQDGPNWVGGVNYSSTDRFCLDGQRLVNIANPAGPANGAAGVYGVDQTYYSTERESFSRVQSLGTSFFGGPTYFVVKTKAGLTMEYGNTTDSAINPLNGVGAHGIHVWALNKVTDAFGNYMTVTYNAPDNNGQYYPIEIDYAGNAGAAPALSPANKVVFMYAARPDQNTKYQGGSFVKPTVRLSQIITKTSAGATVVRQYGIDYEPTFFDRNDSYVLDVTECDSASNCLPATRVDYSAPNGVVTDSLLGTGGGSGYWTGYALANSQPFMFLGDFNGDGKTDLMYYNNTGWTVMTRNTAGQWVGTNWGQGTGNGYWPGWSTGSSQAFQFTGDFNGDGKTDYMYWNNNGWTVLLSTGSGWTEQNWGKGSGTGYWLGYQSGTQQFQMTGDFNGDGKTDFMYWNGAGWTVLLSTGAGWNEVNFGKGTGTGYWLGYQTGSQSFHMTGDFNGDGKTDFMYWNGAGWTVLLSTGSGWIEQNWGKGTGPGYWTSYQTATRQSFHFTGDFNGDGKTDFMYWDGTGWRVLLSTGTGWSEQVFGKGDGLGYWSSWNKPSSQSFAFTGDFNGDGKTDFMYWEDNVGWKVLYSTGSGWIPRVLGQGSALGYWSAFAQTSTQPFQTVGDFNGAGKTDYIYWDNAQWRMLSDNGLRQMNYVANGQGATISLTYATPSQAYGNRYTQSVAATAPQVAVTPTWAVVTDVDTNNGVGGTNRTSYWYDSAVAEVSTGRGFSGFNYIQSQDVTTGLVARTNWRQDFPFAGLVDQTAKGTSTAGWNNLGQTFNQYTFNNFSGNCLSSPGMRYFVYASQIDSINNKDLTAAGQPGSGLAGSRTNQTMDKWGNATNVTVQALNPDNSASGYNKVTVNTYGIDVNSWFLSPQLTSTTTSSSGAALISNSVTGCISVSSGTGGNANGTMKTVQPVPPGSGSRL